VSANPEAIAWYLERSERLLDEMRERAFSLRARGGQFAGFAGAVLALAGANVDSILGSLDGGARDCAGASLLVGVLLLVASLVVVLRGTVLPESVSIISADEVAHYVTARFTDEPDLWRVHLRTIQGLRKLIELTTNQGDDAERSLRKAEYFFFAGLLAVAIALAIFIVEVTL
jgi:cytochrome c biogenesis factor